MLIRFKVKNYLSFNQETEVLLTPGKVRKHKEHILKSEKRTGIDILKHGIFYGANASGKSNLVKAIALAKKMIVAKHKPEKNIPIKPFKLVENYQKHKSQFEFEIKYEDNYYAYGFNLKRNKIFEEWLYSINKNRDKKLYERKTDKDGNVEVDLDGLKLKGKEKDRVKFIGSDTRENQLFLNAINERNIQNIKGVEPIIHVLNWFKSVLVVINPDSKYKLTEINLKRDKNFLEAYNMFLKQFDTGIDRIYCKEVKINGDLDKIDIPGEVIEDIYNNLDRGSFATISGPNNERCVIQKTKNQEKKVLKIYTEHNIIDTDGFVEFDVREESDGTNRMLDIIPILLQSKLSNKVFVVDELDRSLHPALTHKLIEIFSELTKDSASQLLATTHDTALLDLNLLRRDEIWFIEKAPDGDSDIYSLEEFKPRHDKDVEKGYLFGRYGAIPFLSDNLSWLKEG